MEIISLIKARNPYGFYYRLALPETFTGDICLSRRCAETAAYLRLHLAWRPVT
ncbi:hypothetical protein Hanom_Chr06g00578351 [Helianthus anomalus]